MKIIIEFAPRSCHENIGDNRCKESIKAPSTLVGDVVVVLHDNLEEY